MGRIRSSRLQCSCRCRCRCQCRCRCLVLTHHRHKCPCRCPFISRARLRHMQLHPLSRCSRRTQHHKCLYQCQCQCQWRGCLAISSSSNTSSSSSISRCSHWGAWEWRACKRRRCECPRHPRRGRSFTANSLHPAAHPHPHPHPQPHPLLLLSSSKAALPSSLLCINNSLSNSSLNSNSLSSSNSSSHRPTRRTLAFPLPLGRPRLHTAKHHCLQARARPGREGRE